MSMCEKFSILADFDTFWWKEKETQSMTEFVSGWQERLSRCSQAGIVFSDLFLGLKLILALRLSNDLQSSLLSTLDILAEDKKKHNKGMGGMLMELILRLDTVKLETNDILPDTHSQNGVFREEKEEEGRVKEEKYLSEDAKQQHYDILGEKNSENEEEESYYFDCDVSMNYSDDDYTEEKDPLNCHFCNVKFLSLDKYDQHKNDEIMSCKDCDKQFVGCATLKKHMKIHSAFKCDQCNKSFPSKVKLKSHKCQDYSCKNCDKKFSLKKSWENHVIGEKCKPIFECDVCKEKFKGKRELVRHKSSAHGFKCQVPGCDVVCLNPGKLTRHMYKHTRPLACEHCGKCFGAHSVLRKHKMRHHGEGNHPCPECDKKFVGRYELERHMTVHTGAKPFKCSMCPQAFTQKHICTRHEEKHRQELFQ
eukprot:TRINITY_DN35599_c0_g1_i1.p1 TRINITY_DN35599_c0_g1~~TRINITY_DN35599_c0_g1_i1.p1  ORF type:complete len:421 (-),score=82.54 TRINITY_DN35599_c0_g1_i1:120-1382(-)